jgi:hypothetical protein
MDSPVSILENEGPNPIYAFPSYDIEINYRMGMATIELIGVHYGATLNWFIASSPQG